MTEKTEYITASIELLEKRDELNSDELAVLCNLKKFMYQSSHQPATAEQIATFKCAEIKREIGLIIKKGDADWIEIVEDIEEYLAEELQEVGDGESNKSS